MSLSPRDVVDIWDKRTRPEKPKIHLCVCPERKLFLRINSESFWVPNHPLLHRNNAHILSHDSYVELNMLVRNRDYEISRARLRGRLTLTESRSLVATARSVATLSEDEKDLIDARLS